MSARRRRKPRIPGAKRAARPVSGRGFPDLCIDYAAVRRNAVQNRPPTRAEIAAREAAREPLEYRALVAAWENAERGAPKRDALASLRAHEARHGRMPYGGELRESKMVDVSTGAESWLEVK